MQKYLQPEDLFTCKDKVLPLSVKSLHLTVWLLDTIEPSSTLRNPDAYGSSLLLLSCTSSSADPLSATIGWAPIPKTNAALIIFNQSHYMLREGNATVIIETIQYNTTLFKKFQFLKKKNGIKKVTCLGK